METRNFENSKDGILKNTIREMKKVRIYFRIFTFIFFIAIILQAQDSTVAVKSGDLIVRLLEFSSDDGKAMIAIYNDENDYNSNNVFRAFILEIVNGVAEHTFSNIPFGNYAVKTYHDKNENGELDTNFLGIPTEDYGFSNNADGTFGPPDFEEAMFEFKIDQQIIEIVLD